MANTYTQVTSRPSKGIYRYLKQTRGIAIQKQRRV